MYDCGILVYSTYILGGSFHPLKCYTRPSRSLWYKTACSPFTKDTYIFCGKVCGAACLVLLRNLRGNGAALILRWGTLCMGVLRAIGRVLWCDGTGVIR